MTIGGAVVLADLWDTNGHMGGGWWIVMMFGMVVFWGAVIVGIVWLARGGSYAGPRDDGSPGARRESPLEILDRRFAAGEISEDEYAQRRQVLTGASAKQEGGHGT